MKKSWIILMAFLMPVIMVQAQENSSTKRAKVVIVTDMGEIEMELYNETPLHRDNFLKLAREGYYNGSIFHRVINQFMIQGGGGADGNSDPGYTVPAEIVPAFFHHRGALCAARMPDQVNPKKASSGSQFYIVHGRTFTDQELTAYGARTGKSWTEAQKAEYRTKGGAPHLDGDYTVYGRVTKGMEVVDKIAAVQTGDANRPIKEVKMTVRILQE
ncbi:MAG: peptidylprolyl isomerase [Lentimicrobiaceae bacterium]|nr:peptidylprolyl isomerase [Lentimicrobiaceae bacterium]